MHSLADLERVLAQRPRATVDMVMARAVLRTVPFLGGHLFGAPEGAWPKEWSDSALVLFRAILLPWLTAVQTADSERLRDLARSHLAADAAGKVRAFQAHRANLAADLAVRAAYAVHADEKTSARAAARLVLASLEEWFGFCEPALLRDIEQMQRGDVSHLRTLKLLLDAPPQWMSDRWKESWNKLCAGLETRPDGQGWRTVWLDWFEAVDRGEPPWGMVREDSDRILLDAMFWPQAEWDRGPQHINHRLAEIIAARRHRR